MRPKVVELIDSNHIKSAEMHRLKGDMGNFDFSVDDKEDEKFLGSIEQ
jgi:hypothetical protein